MKSLHRFLATSVIAVLFPLGIPVDHVNAAGACIPPAPGAQTQAQCTFDIWGYVYKADGSPASSAYVSDGGHYTYANASGFYDLYETAPGGYTITARTQCSTSVFVDDTYNAMLYGGARVNLHLPC